MKHLLAAALTFFVIQSPQELFASVCSPQADSDELINRDDFPWSQSLEEIADLSQKIYESNKRSKDRAYAQNGLIVLPVEKTTAEAWAFNFDKLILKPSFIETLKKQIKIIKEKNYGQELIYSDIGHVHIFAFIQDSRELKKQGYTSSQAEFYEKILHSKNTKFLYHTSEQLRAPKNEIEEWRKNNRTVIGLADGSVQISDFTKTIENYSQFFSIYFNANKSGCFELDETNFDISLSSPK